MGVESYHKEFSWLRPEKVPNEPIIFFFLKMISNYYINSMKLISEMSMIYP